MHFFALSLMAPTRATTRAKAPAWACLSEPRTHGSKVHAARPLGRPHAPTYHRPYLLDQPDTAQHLLAWFDHKQHDRDMPWRQAWIEPDVPHSSKRPRLDAEAPLTREERIQRRAYEVWISEIMLQQTRVETVREYWKAWMEKWPTLEALANASVDDVLAVWRGLGYYGRARRIHEAAQKVMTDPHLRGQLPANAQELMEHIPGVGPYTAGAISSIVFGHAVPILDGNVARVLCRQTGLYSDPRAKSTNDLLWHMARMLVESVAPHERSDVPGRWNQGLMELGSTLCTPTRPGCDTCPIKPTCLTYAEGRMYEGDLAQSEEKDMEDLCTWCAPIPDPADDSTDVETTSPKKKKSLQQMTLTGKKAAPPKKSQGLDLCTKYTQLFPMRIAKQPPRNETRLVCIIRATSFDGVDLAEPLYMISQRPDQGLLAKLWEFPTDILPIPYDEELDDSTCMDRTHDFVASLRPPPPMRTSADQGPAAGNAPVILRPTNVRRLGRVRHEFSHLHWHMHVVLAEVDALSPRESNRRDKTLAASASPSSYMQPIEWALADGVEAASMGTGLQRCWSLLTRSV